VHLVCVSVCLSLENHSVIFVSIYFLVLVLVFQLLFRFRFVLVFFRYKHNVDLFIGRFSVMCINFTSQDDLTAPNGQLWCRRAYLFTIGIRDPQAAKSQIIIQTDHVTLFIRHMSWNCMFCMVKLFQPCHIFRLHTVAIMSEKDLTAISSDTKFRVNHTLWYKSAVGWDSVYKVGNSLVYREVAE